MPGASSRRDPRDEPALADSEPRDEPAYAESTMRMLAHRSAGAQRIPIVDYLVAAAAQEAGAAVLHYDPHYDTLSEIMAFESAWLAPPGSLP